MMAAINDLSGQKFGRLTVIGLDRIKGRAFWDCLCSCGATKPIRSDHLVSGGVVSCGCHSSEATATRNVSRRTHGMTNSAEFKAWRSLRSRCQNPDHPNYADYGGRGITVCERWESFEAFFADMGFRPSTKHSIDRVNNDLGYDPSNCRWATHSEQMRNRRPFTRRQITGTPK